MHAVKKNIFSACKIVILYATARRCMCDDGRCSWRAARCWQRPVATSSHDPFTGLLYVLCCGCGCFLSSSSFLLSSLALSFCFWFTTALYLFLFAFVLLSFLFSSPFASAPTHKPTSIAEAPSRCALVEAPSIGWVALQCCGAVSGAFRHGRSLHSSFSNSLCGMPPISSVLSFSRVCNGELIPSFKACHSTSLWRFSTHLV